MEEKEKKVDTGIISHSIDDFEKGSSLRQSQLALIRVAQHSISSGDMDSALEIYKRLSSASRIDEKTRQKLTRNVEDIEVHVVRVKQRRSIGTVPLPTPGFQDFKIIEQEPMPSSPHLTYETQTQVSETAEPDYQDTSAANYPETTLPPPPIDVDIEPPKRPEEYYQVSSISDPVSGSVIKNVHIDGLNLRDMTIDGFAANKMNLNETLESFPDIVSKRVDNTLKETFLKDKKPLMEEIEGSAEEDFITAVEEDTIKLDQEFFEDMEKLKLDLEKESLTSIIKEKIPDRRPYADDMEMYYESLHELKQGLDLMTSREALSAIKDLRQSLKDMEPIVPDIQGEVDDYFIKPDEKDEKPELDFEDLADRIASRLVIDREKLQQRQSSIGRHPDYQVEEEDVSPEPPLKDLIPQKKTKEPELSDDELEEIIDQNDTMISGTIPDNLAAPEGEASLLGLDNPVGESILPMDTDKEVPLPTLSNVMDQMQEENENSIIQKLKEKMAESKPSTDELDMPLGGLGDVTGGIESLSYTSDKPDSDDIQLSSPMFDSVQDFGPQPEKDLTPPEDIDYVKDDGEKLFSGLDEGVSGIPDLESKPIIAETQSPHIAFQSPQSPAMPSPMESTGIIDIDDESIPNIGLASPDADLIEDSGIPLDMPVTAPSKTSVPVTEYHHQPPEAKRPSLDELLQHDADEEEIPEPVEPVEIDLNNEFFEKMKAEAKSRQEDEESLDNIIKRELIFQRSQRIPANIPTEIPSYKEVINLIEEKISVAKAEMEEKYSLKDGETGSSSMTALSERIGDLVNVIMSTTPVSPVPGFEQEATGDQLPKDSLSRSKNKHADLIDDQQEATEEQEPDDQDEAGTIDIDLGGLENEEVAVDKQEETFIEENEPEKQIIAEQDAEEESEPELKTDKKPDFDQSDDFDLAPPSEEGEVHGKKIPAAAFTPKPLPKKKPSEYIPPDEDEEETEDEEVEQVKPPARKSGKMKPKQYEEIEEETEEEYFEADEEVLIKEIDADTKSESAFKYGLPEELKREYAIPPEDTEDKEEKPFEFLTLDDVYTPSLTYQEIETKEHAFAGDLLEQHLPGIDPCFFPQAYVPYIDYRNKNGFFTNIEGNDITFSPKKDPTNFQDLIEIRSKLKEEQGEEIRELDDQTVARLPENQDLQNELLQFLKEEREERYQDRRMRSFMPGRKKVRLTYDFSNLFMHKSYRKYKDLLNEAAMLVANRKLDEALEYYKVILEQNIPLAFRMMIEQNVDDILNTISNTFKQSDTIVSVKDTGDIRRIKMEEQEKKKVRQDVQIQSINQE